MGSEARDPARVALSIAPFAGAALLAWVTVLIGSSIDWSQYALATGLLLVSGALSLTGLPGFRMGSVPVSLAYLAAVGLLRSSAGGINAGSGMLALIPVFYTALHRSRRELAVVLLATLAFYVAPILLVGPPSYPHSQYRAALLSVVISAIIGITTQRLVGSVRGEARSATAIALERADTISQLTDMAETDPLTGLPNRRAWDACVNEALGEGRQLTIAMLDLDHFKQFNDQHGHPAGDRLLKETAAIWREQLRAGDLLARLGGEEFGLLLLDGSAQQARDTIERLRDQMPHEQTCSAGFAVQAPGESVEEVMFRADAALYLAKSSGRNRACMDA